MPARTHAFGPLRVVVCPRHYGHFAVAERARWSVLADVGTAAPVALDDRFSTHGEPAEMPVGAVLAAGEGIASE